MIVTLDEVKEYLQIPSEDTSLDVKLQYITDGIEKRTKTFCKQDFVLAEYTERIKFEGGFGYVTNTPLVSISKVEDDDGYEYPFEIYADKQGEISLLFLTNREYIVTYTGGVAVEDIPSDIKLAILQWVEYTFNNQAGIKNFSITGYSQSVQLTPEGMPFEVSRILNSYTHNKV